MSQSIHPNPRSIKSKVRKKSNHGKNRSIRAQLYQSHNGNSSWNNRISEWHDVIRALQLGTA